MEADPFPGLKIAAADFLDATEGRSSCPKCGKSRKYYCYTCYVSVAENADKVPRVKLPIKLDIIKHPSECDGKSTAAHAGVLAPDDVRVYSYPVIPDYADHSKVLLVFPGDNSVTIEELAKNFHKTHAQPVKASEPSEDSENNSNSSGGNSAGSSTELTEGGAQESQSQTSPRKRLATETEDKGPNVKRLKPDPTTSMPGYSSAATNIVDSSTQALPYERVVFIDSTWNQTKKIFCDERLQGLKQVELKSQTTRFWRHQQDKPKTYLATIEAIYFFMREFHEAFVSQDYEGQYDNLLFFYSFMYHKIRALYNEGKHLKAYK